MSTTEDRARAAMRAIGATVTDAPPLPLTPAPDPGPAPDEIQFGGDGPDRPGRAGVGRHSLGEHSAGRHSLGEHSLGRRALGLRRPGGALRSPDHGGRNRRRSLLAPVEAAVTVVAVAVALVAVRHLPAGGSGPVPATLPGGVPRYYVAVDPADPAPWTRNQLLVGDALTGKAIATFTSPKNMSFESVSGAADDRTFVAVAVADPVNPTFVPAAVWYKVTLDPGTAHPATLTRLPIEPRFTEVVATALSSSGQELAVGGVPMGAGRRGVQVFSLATGKLLHDWVTNDPTALVSNDLLDNVSQYPALTWIDNDRAIAFAAISQAGATDPGTVDKVTVRRLNVVGARDGDLMADSQLIWTAPSAGTRSAGLCEETSTLVSADGKTVTCATLNIQQGKPPAGAGSLNSETVAWAFAFSTYRLAAGTPSGRKTVAYQTVRQAPNPAGGLVAALWTSPSGDALIGEWAIGPIPVAAANPSPSSSAASSENTNSASNGAYSSSVSIMLEVPPSAFGPAHIGVISHGKFTPLLLPPGFTPVTAGHIAW
jgi:hypothetical protein